MVYQLFVAKRTMKSELLDYFGPTPHWSRRGFCVYDYCRMHGIQSELGGIPEFYLTETGEFSEVPF